jgi:hypothetical protein
MPAGRVGQRNCEVQREALTRFKRFSLLRLWRGIVEDALEASSQLLELEPQLRRMVSRHLRSLAEPVELRQKRLEAGHRAGKRVPEAANKVEMNVEMLFHILRLFFIISTRELQRKYVILLLRKHLHHPYGDLNFSGFKVEGKCV